MNRVIGLLLCVLASVGPIIAAVAADGECDAGSADGTCDATVSGAVATVPDDSDEPAGADVHPRCAAWAARGECADNPRYMLADCRASCAAEYGTRVAEYGPPQEVLGNDPDGVLAVIRATVAYMRDDIHGPDARHSLSEEMLAACVNREERCAFWAAVGECDSNKGYMQLQCAPSCQSCDMLDIDARCPPLGEDVTPGLVPGALNAMFERIVATAPGNHTEDAVAIAEDTTNYSVHVHSRPKPWEEGEDAISIFRDLAQPPWVLTLDDFLTEDECAHLIKLGYKMEFKKSKDFGAVQPDGSYLTVESSGRTSENAGCSYQRGCRNDAVVERIHDRMSRVTGLPGNHSEDLQILKYEPGQFDRKHHDYIPHQRDRRGGPRVLTFFLYLTDADKGGATNFPELGIFVKPKVGRAVLWPSVLDSDPRDRDTRTAHRVVSVIAGTTFGAKAWLHLHDYMAAAEMGCTH